jgi:hypothetical protein
MSGQRLSVLLLAIFFGSLVGSSLAAPTCTAVPIALSDLRSCENNYCYFSEVVTAAIPLGDTNSLCLEFVPPDSVGASVPLNITVDHSHFKWTADYVYFTDAVAVSSVGYCSCPGSPSGNFAGCPNCLAYPQYSDVVLCNQGLHHDESCGLTWTGAAGSYCTKTGFSASNRFKIISWKPQLVTDVGLAISSTYANQSLSWAVEYHGELAVFNDDSLPFNITVISDTAKVSFTPQYSLFDITSPLDFYFFTSDEVNALDQFDYSKIGWYKTDQNKKYNSDLLSSIGTKLEDCTNDRFTFTYPWVNVIDFLTQHQSRLSRYYSPGSMLSDPNYLQVGTMFGQNPEHTSNPYIFVSTGWIEANLDDVPQPFGWTAGGDIVPTPQQLSFFTALGNNTQIWVESGLTNVSSGYQYVDFTLPYKCNVVQVYSNVIASDGTEVVYSAFRCALSSVKAFNVFCQGTMGAPSCGFTGDPWHINNYTMIGRSWPELTYFSQHYVNGTYSKSIVGSSSAATTTHMYTEINNGVLNVNIQFKNFTVFFENTVISPKFISATAKNATITVVAQSLTVAGTCFISSEPAELLTAQPVTLTVSASSYSLDANLPLFSDVATLLLNCYKKTAKISLNVDYNIQINQSLAQNETVTNNVSSQICSLNDFSSCGTSFFANPSNWGNIFSGIGDGNNNNNLSWWQWVLLALEILAGVVAFFLIGVPTIKLVVWVLRKMRVRKANSGYTRLEDMYSMKKIQ